MEVNRKKSKSPVAQNPASVIRTYKDKDKGWQIMTNGQVFLKMMSVLSAYIVRSLAKIDLGEAWAATRIEIHTMFEDRRGIWAWCTLKIGLLIGMFAEANEARFIHADPTKVPKVVPDALLVIFLISAYFVTAYNTWPLLLSLSRITSCFLVQLNVPRPFFPITRKCVLGLSEFMLGMAASSVIASSIFFPTQPVVILVNSSHVQLPLISIFLNLLVTDLLLWVSEN